MFGLSHFSQLYEFMRCPQILLNNMQDFDKTWCTVRYKNGDMHVMRNLIVHVFAEDMDVWT